MKNAERNIAYIDGQNLYFNTAKRASDSWTVDLKRFRIYLADHYHVTTAYYFLGFVQEENDALYDSIQEAGFILKFREHSSVMLGKKKGNVDSDIIFHLMKKMYVREPFEKVVLVSGDGDYKALVDFLVAENRFEKILFPDRQFASSLYKRLGARYFDYLDNLKTYIAKMKRAKNEKGS